MNTMLLFLQTFIYCYMLWLGLYLLARAPRTRLMLFGGIGTVVYALMLALDLLTQMGSGTRWLSAISWPLPLLLSIFWTLAILALMPKSPTVSRYNNLLIIVYVVAYGMAAGTTIFFDYSTNPPAPTGTYPVFGAAVIIPLVGALVALIKLHPQRSRTILILATLFAILGCASLLLIWQVIPRPLLLLSLATDLALFGGAIAVHDAHSQNEVLLPHYLRSMNAAFIAAFVFGGQIGLVMVLSTGITASMVGLLLTVCSAAISWQVFADPLQKFLDRLTFVNSPRLRQSRAELRDVSSNLPRLDQSPDWKHIGEEEFIRITRRALTNFGNLPKLATSPLTMLPQIEQRINNRQAASNALERAAELKQVLAESVECLKPRDGKNFGTSDEWRYYNAVYFPYVCGLKPYSRKDRFDMFPHATQEAMVWFQAQVPERTLHNWQNAAAKLIAQILREDLP